MEIDVIINRDGTLAVLARGGGAFAEARDRVLAVIAQLTAAGIPLENISAVERHQHNEAEEAVAHSVHEKTKA